jgi:PmbA protein
MDTLAFEAANELTEEDARTVADGGALILNVLGVHTQDATSGDFSLSVPQALQIVGGSYAGKMKATISGNLFEVLRDPATEFVRFPGEHTPGLVIRCRLDPR